MSKSQDVLLVFSGEDCALAEKIEALNTERGLSSSRYEVDKVGSGSEAAAMVEASKCVVCIFSQKVQWGPAVKNLVDISLKEGKFIGLKIDGSKLPEELQNIQIVDLSFSEESDRRWHNFWVAVKKITKSNFELPDLPVGEPGLKQPFVKKDGQAYMWYGAATTGVWLASEEYRRQREAEAEESGTKNQESMIKNRQTAALDRVQGDSLPKVFVSYSRKDHGFIAELNKKFESFHLPFWWDEEIPPSEEWASEIKRRLAAVNCILVIWSKNSVVSDWVLLEAQEAYKSGRLLGIRIDEECVIPEPYSQAETVDFVGQSFAVNDPAWRELFKRIGKLSHSDFWAKFEARPDGIVGVL